MGEGDKPRFWYGVHDQGFRTSAVLWDRENQPRKRPFGNGMVRLFNLKANELNEYPPDQVRPQLRALEPEEHLLRDELRSKYFPALSKYMRDLHASREVNADDYCGETDGTENDPDPDYHEDGPDAPY